MVGGAVAPLIVNHASADPRFAEHPGYRLHGIESYIAVPLTRRDGSRFGTLCALDNVPAHLTERDLDVFRLLADLIAFELEADEQAQRRAAGERERASFIQAIAHDLKAPLASVKAQAQLMGRRLQRGGDPDVPWLQERARVFDRLATRAAAHIDELADLARMETGEPLELRHREVDLVALVGRIVDEHDATGAQHQLRFHAGESSIPGQVDPARIERVAANLIGNAIKFSPAGGEVAVELDRLDGHAVLRVRDEGIGIPPESQDAIFSFRRRGENVGAIPGSGVGLAGAAQLVRLHGGTIAVESEEGRGSTFTVLLPLQPPGMVAAAGS